MPASESGQAGRAVIACRSPLECAHSRLKTVFFATTAALCFALAFPDRLGGLWPLVLLAPAGLAWAAINARSTRWLLLVVFLTQFAMWMWLDRWLVRVTMAGYPPKAVYMTLYPCAYVLIIRVVARHPKTKMWPMALIVPLVWGGLEILRGRIVFNGYPWYLLAHPLVEWPVLVQSADLLGTYFVSLLAAMIPGAAVDAIRIHARQMTARPAFIAIGVVGVVWIGQIGYGMVRIGQTPAATSNEPRLIVLAIQTNLPQDNKVAWTPDAQERDVASFIALTREAWSASGGDADVIAWPETMLPVWGLDVAALEFMTTHQQRRQLDFVTAIIGLRDDFGVPVIVGAPTYENLRVDDSRAVARAAWDEEYNSVYVIDEAMPFPRYDKLVLTPFGEYMPYISRWSWLEERLLAFGAQGMAFNLDRGAGVTRLPVGDVTLASPICFEDTIPGLCRRLVYDDGVKVPLGLLNLSNDGWFGSHDGGRAHHAQIARFRCVENRVPMIRSVNTGYSVAVDSAGNLIGRVADGRYGRSRQAGWVRAELRADRRVAVYGRLGDGWTWLVLAALATMLAWMRVGSRKG